MGRHSRTRTPRSGRWAAVAVGTVAALVAALAPPAAHAEDTGELGVIVREASDTDQVIDAPVTLYDAEGSQVWTEYTDWFGEVAFTVSPGTYFVGTDPAGYDAEFFDGSPDLEGATPIEVTAGSDRTVLIYVGGSAEPLLDGTVTGPGGDPVDGADVTVYEYDADFDDWWWADSATTDADGHYEFSFLADGTYRVGFEASGFTPEFYDDAPDVESGDDVQIVEGSLATADAQLSKQCSSRAR